MSCGFGNWCALGGLSVLNLPYTVIKETEVTGKIYFNIIFVIVITQIVLVIVASYFIFRVHSCVFTISAVFSQPVYCKLTQFTSGSIWIASWLATAVYKFKKVIRCWFHCCNSSSISSSSKTHPWLAEIPSELIEYVERNVKMLICFSLFVKCKKLFVNVINIPRTAHVPQVVLLNLCY